MMSGCGILTNGKGTRREYGEYNLDELTVKPCHNTACLNHAMSDCESMRKFTVLFSLVGRRQDRTGKKVEWSSSLFY